MLAEIDKPKQRQFRALAARAGSVERYPLRVPPFRVILYRGKLAVEMVCSRMLRRRLAVAVPVSDKALAQSQIDAATTLYEWSPRVTPEVRAVLQSRLSFARSRAAARDIESSLTIEDLEAKFDAQRGLCAVTGLMMDVGPGSDDMKWRRPFRVSIDRIDSSGAYAPENTRLVCSAVNNALGPWGEAVFAVIAQAYVSRDRKDV